MDEKQDDLKSGEQTSNAPLSQEGVSGGIQPPPVKKEWYVYINGQQKGLFTTPEIVGMVKNGTLKTMDLIWKNGMPQWKSIKDVPELMQHLSVLMGLKSEQMQETGKKMIETSKVATANAFSAFKKFSVDPVGGLLGAYQSLSKTAAMSAGIVFDVVFVLCVILSIKIAGLTEEMETAKNMWFWVIIGSLTPPIGMLLALIIIRNALRIRETIHADVFIAGATILFLGLFFIVGSIFMKNFNPGTLFGMIMMSILVAFLISYTILILFSGLTKIYGLTDSKASFVLPMVLVVSSALTYLMIKQIIKILLENKI